MESESQTQRRNIVMKRQVRDRVIDSEEAIGTDRVLMRVGGVRLFGIVCLCARPCVCKAPRISAH